MMGSKVGSLSGGQRQAMALLMTTMAPIEILILDEHTAALDPKTAELIMELTGKVVKEKKLTTIMVTHNLRYAVEYGNRILMMHQGHAVLDKAGEEKAKLVVDDLLDLSLIHIFGNRNYDNALIELRNELENNHFHTIAAGAFVAQHAFTDQLAMMRPGKSDQ